MHVEPDQPGAALPPSQRAGHHITVRPFRLSGVDETLHVRVLRGVGFRFLCSCGERGRVKGSVAAAREDGRLHRVAALNSPSGGV